MIAILDLYGFKKTIEVAHRIPNIEIPLYKVGHFFEDLKLKEMRGPGTKKAMFSYDQDLADGVLLYNYYGVK